MLEPLKRLLKKQNKLPRIIIGNHTLDIAQPTLRRYLKLSQLINLPNNDAILKARFNLETLINKYNQETDDAKRQNLQSEIKQLNDFIISETQKHGKEIQSLIDCSNIEKLKAIIETVCVCHKPISNDDILNSFESQIFFAVDFFLSERIRTFNSTFQKFSTFVNESKP